MHSYSYRYYVTKVEGYVSTRLTVVGCSGYGRSWSRWDHMNYCTKPCKVLLFLHNLLLNIYTRNYSALALASFMSRSSEVIDWKSCQYEMQRHQHCLYFRGTSDLSEGELCIVTHHWKDREALWLFMANISKCGPQLVYLFPMDHEVIWLSSHGKEMYVPLSLWFPYLKDVGQAMHRATDFPWKQYSFSILGFPNSVKIRASKLPNLWFSILHWLMC